MMRSTAPVGAILLRCFGSTRSPRCYREVPPEPQRIEFPNAGASQNATDSFRCFTSARVRGTYVDHEYPLHFPSRVIDEANGKRIGLAFRERFITGDISRRADCILPASSWALSTTLRRFRGGPYRHIDLPSYVLAIQDYSDADRAAIASAVTLLAERISRQGSPFVFADGVSAFEMTTTNRKALLATMIAPAYLGEECRWMMNHEGYWVYDCGSITATACRDDMEATYDDETGQCICTEGKSPDPDTGTCQCDNGSAEDDCYLPPPDGDDPESDPPPTTDPDPDPPPDPDESYAVELDCPLTSVERASGILCTTTGTVGDTSVFEWRFEPGSIRLFDTDLPAVYGEQVSGPSGVGETSWGGVMVYPGCIIVEASPDPDGTGTGGTVSAEECITIDDRSGPDWQTSDTVKQRPTLIAAWGRQPRPGVTVGLNFQENGDTLAGLVEFFGKPEEMNRINDGGPNDGYEYFATGSLNIEVRREWQLNRHIDPGGPMIGKTSAGDSLNFWNATISVGGSPSALVAGIKAHETYGTPGDGHQEMLRKAMDGDECGSVRRRLERVAGKPPLRAEDAASRVIRKAEEYLNRAIDFSHGWVGNNFQGTIAVWDSVATEFDTVAIGDPLSGASKTAPQDCNVLY